MSIRIVPLVRGLGRPRADHRSELFRRRVDPQVSTATASGRCSAAPVPAVGAGGFRFARFRLGSFIVPACLLAVQDTSAACRRGRTRLVSCLRNSSTVTFE